MIVINGSGNKLMYRIHYTVWVSAEWFVWINVYICPWFIEVKVNVWLSTKIIIIWNLLKGIYKEIWYSKITYDKMLVAVKK